MEITNKCSVISNTAGLSLSDIFWNKREDPKRCSVGECTYNARKGSEVCIRHGEKVKTCSHEGCTNIVQGEVCIMHSAKAKSCSHDGCTSYVQIGGVCTRHLTYEGCANIVQKGEDCAKQLPLSNAVASILPAKTAAVNKTKSTVRRTRIRKNRKRKMRVLDESHAVKPTDNDILFGRGKSVNAHPGNNYFRLKALELLPQYKQSCKEDKQIITNLLIESVKREGHRFLEKGGSGLWHEVIDGVFSKASQTFRDL